MSSLYKDRIDAGQQLAGHLKHYAGRADTVVLGLARGGLPVAMEVAKALHAPLDVYIVRKLGTPGQPELAAGALGPGGVVVFNEDIMSALGLREADMAATITAESQEMQRRERTYRGSHAPADVRDRTVILVDDGLATGATMKAAIAALRAQEAGHIVVAVPVGARETCYELGQLADELVCIMRPQPFHSVGTWYRSFPQTSDEEVRELLQRSRRAGDGPG